MEDTVDILNELLIIHYRSLPMYLTVTTPWTHRGDEKATETVSDIVSDQKATCQRLAETIVHRGGVIETGDFPSQFTDTHFLSLDFMLRELVTAQQNDVRAIEACVKRLWNDPPAEAVGKEALGAARGHLQSLEELVGGMSRST